MFSSSLWRLPGLLVLLLALSGCRQDDQIEQLRRENPFTNQPSGDPGSILIVTCRFSPLEMPGHVDITTLPFWKEYALEPEKEHQSAGIVSGFSSEQLTSWHNNGMQVAFVPMSQWQGFRDSLVGKGAVESAGRTAVFHNAAQAAELPGYWLEEGHSLFVRDFGATLRGYTLTAGDCFFRLNCIPPGQMAASQIDNLFIKIVPVFRSAIPAERLRETRSGYVREFPEIVFDRLTVSGIMRNDYFLCIAYKPDFGTNENLGGLFLARESGADNYQRLIALAPYAQTAAELKDEW